MKRLLVLLAAVAAISLGGVAPAHADTNDFTFSSFDGKYTLSQDSAGHSELKTVETLVAQFPDFDQNHGILRELPTEYLGHPTFLDVKSVTDAAGQSISYDTDSSDGVLELKIGDADSYVHGTKTYVITYTQKYVDSPQSRDDEFYWNTNGNQWEQPFDHVTATLTVAPGLTSALTGDVTSVAGAYGAKDLPSTATRSGNTFLFSADSVGPGQNLTMVVGFAKGTFTPKPTGFFQSPWPVLALIALLFVILALVLAIVVRVTRLSDAPGRGTIIPEYVAPKGVSLAMAAVIRGSVSKVTPAMIISLAVNGNLRILELNSGKRKPTYELQYITADGLGADELEFMHALFGPTFEADEVHSLATNDISAAKQITVLVSRVRADATTQGYRKKRPLGRIALVSLLAIGATILTFFFAITALDQQFGGPIPVFFLPAAIVLTIVTIGLMSRTPLDAKGVELRDYLKGLKMYIDLAEEDRLRYLQSPQGAEKTPVATDDKTAIVKLNEKLLPYAVLFGNELQWAKELGKYYEETGSQPGWYSGYSAFNAVYFASTIGSINATASASFVNTQSSSSSGFGGGGFSGGGGGGGGGGGW